MGAGRARLFLERALGCARAFRRDLLGCSGLPFAVVPFCAYSCRLFRFARMGRCERDAGATCFTESDSDRLLWRAGTVLALPYVLDFFVNEFSGCGGGRFPFFQIFFCLLDYFLFRHKFSLLVNLDAGTRKLARGGSRVGDQLPARST